MTFCQRTSAEPEIANTQLDSELISRDWDEPDITIDENAMISKLKALLYQLNEWNAVFESPCPS